MPFHRREQPRQIAFEVVDDLDDGDDVCAPRPSRLGAPSGPSDPLPDDVAPVAADGVGTRSGEDGIVAVSRDPRGHRRRRLLVAGVAGVIVLVLVGLTVLDTVRAREADALLRTAPGGVVGLTQPPRELWSLDAGEARPTFAGNRVLLGRDDALVAHDLASGEEVWRVASLAGFQCQSDDSSAVAAAASTTVTCLSGGTPRAAGPGDAATVAVVGLDGAVLARRELDPSRGLAQVLSDGDLVRGASDGRAATVSVEDARTGTVRWTRTFARDDAAAQDGSCEGSPDLLLDDRGSLISAFRCGVDVNLTHEGDLLPAADDAYVRPLGGGRLVRISLTGGPMDVLDAEGALLWSTAGTYFLELLATDGTAPRLLYSQDGSGFVALDDGGRELWSYDRYTIQILLATQDMTVVATYPGAVAVDNATGEELWTWKDPSLDGSDPGRLTRAFAGRGTLTIVADAGPAGGPSASSRWSSIDLVDGSTRWSTTIPVDAGSLTAVRGRLYSTTAEKVTAFG